MDDKTRIALDVVQMISQQIEAGATGGVVRVSANRELMQQHADDSNELAQLLIENLRLKQERNMLLEACKKASTCASIPDYVMDVIRAAIEKAERG